LRNKDKYFGDILNKYIVLSLHVNHYQGTAHTLESDFQIAGSEVREIIKKDEERLLRQYFNRWDLPFSGKLNGWRNDSPIYILHNSVLVSGIYLCDNNEFNEGDNWGQLHYFYTDQAYKKKGLHSILFQHAINRAKLWNLQGVFINTDRHLLADVYTRWGAMVWKEIKKGNPSKSLSKLMKTTNRILLNMKLI
jgi:GNAT superfamily N-acetyltransferase